VTRGGGDGATDSMHNAVRALAAMEEGGGAAGGGGGSGGVTLRDVAADVPWWNAPVATVTTTVASGSVPPQ
jgi:hypothetical protein